MTARCLLTIAFAMLLASFEAAAEPVDALIQAKPAPAASAGPRDTPQPAASVAATQPVMASG